MNKKAFVVIDNQTCTVLRIFPKEERAKDMLRTLGDEKIGDAFARYAYEVWSWEEVTKWIYNPGEMGLDGQTLTFLRKTLTLPLKKVG